MNAEDALALISIQTRSFSKADPRLLHSYPKERAMDEERIVSFLDGKRYAVLATSRPDGRAQAAPIAFTVWKGAFWIASVEGARVRNLRTRPYASIVIIEGEGKEHRAVIAEGPVQLYTASAIKANQKGLEDLWVKRHGDPTWASVFIELRPERLFSYDAKGE